MRHTNVSIRGERILNIEENRPKWHLAALGELLIDFTPVGKSRQGGALFERNPGGAPANVLVVASKLGLSTAFIGKVGQDAFGEFLKDTLVKQGVDTKGLIMTTEANTTLAFVHLDEGGDRLFSFYRNPGADMLLKESEVDEGILKESSIFHFGSVSMTKEPARRATLKAVERAVALGKTISYDPNLRPPLWDSEREAKEIISQGLPFADILKISEEELEFLTDQKDPDIGSRLLYEKYKTSIILVTLGPDGCFYRSGEIAGYSPGFQVSTIDTTGAGDAFMGGFLYQFIKSGKGVAELDGRELGEAVKFANAMGALTTTKRGAIPAIPSMEEVSKTCLEGVSSDIK